MNLNVKSVLQETKNAQKQKPKLQEQKEEHLLKMEQKTINQKVNRHLLIKEAIHQNKKIWRLQKQQRISLRLTQIKPEKRILESRIKTTLINLIENPMTVNNKRNLFHLIAISTIMVFTACNTTDFFNEYQSLSDGWKKNEPVVFDFESLDTLKTYDAYLNIRTTNEYPYSNLFVIVKMTEPEGASMMDTLQYEMANPDGSMMGSGFTDIKEHKLVWRKNISLKKQGVYTIEVNHATRKINEVNGDVVLNGVIEIGLQLQ